MARKRRAKAAPKRTAASGRKKKQPETKNAGESAPELGATAAEPEEESSISQESPSQLGDQLSNQPPSEATVPSSEDKEAVVLLPPSQGPRTRSSKGRPPSTHKRFGKFRCLNQKTSNEQDEDAGKFNKKSVESEMVQPLLCEPTSTSEPESVAVITDAESTQQVVEESTVEEEEVASDIVIESQDVVMNEESMVQEAFQGQQSDSLPSASAVDETIQSFEVLQVTQNEKEVRPSLSVADVEMSSFAERELKRPPSPFLQPPPMEEPPVSLLPEAPPRPPSPTHLTTPKMVETPEEESVQMPELQRDQEGSTNKVEAPPPPPPPVRRRSSRIKVNRWDDGPALAAAAVAKAAALSENMRKDPPDLSNPFPASGNEPVVATLPPPPLLLGPFDADKPVKVKSRWRRTSELEMGSGGSSAPSPTTGGSNSDPLDESTSPPKLQPSLIPDHPEIEERLKGFEIIPENIFLTTRFRSKEAKRMVCDCTLTKEEIARCEMGCGDDCLNRLLMIECGSRCTLGTLCSNKRFQNRYYTKCDIVKTKRKGLGLICSSNIPSGEFLMEYVGEVLDSKEFTRRAKDYSREKNLHFYFMALKSDAIIDATMKGNISRFINHSCDPNSETQKWTVNGELRIGFFSKRPIRKGEEITFDYQFQRYGKEAQRCYCESENCRGWIGEEPDEDQEEEEDEENEEEDLQERDKEKKQEEVVNKLEKTREKKEKKLREELEDEIEKLRASGVKNRAHTLTLNRLMVRAEDHSSRAQLLIITQAGVDQCCLRLFLDYHGLGLLWSWMIDKSAPLSLKISILNTLAVLPVTNKTILRDSKVLHVVEKWSSLSGVKIEKTDGEGSSPDSEEKSDTAKETEETKVNGTIEVAAGTEDNTSKGSEEDAIGIEANNTSSNDELIILVEKAKNLLEVWSTLKEDFKIPKKERVAQMKEHEREADRGYVDHEKNKKDTMSYDRHWSYDYKDKHDKERHDKDRYDKRDRDRYEKSNRRRGRDSPEHDWRHSRSSRNDERNGGPRLTKTQRRHLFALKVEEEERQKRVNEERWAKHQEQCFALGVDPNTTLYSPQTTGSLPNGFLPRSSSSNQRGDDRSKRKIHNGHSHVEFPPGLPNAAPIPSLLSFTVSPRTTGVQNPGSGSASAYPSNGQTFPSAYQTPDTQYPPPNQAFPPGQQQYPAPGQPYPPPFGPGVPPPILGFQGPGQPPAVNSNTRFPPPQYPPLPGNAPPSGLLMTAPPPPFVPPPPPLPPKLPAKWKTAKDPKGRSYYYHIKLRKSQWTFPTPQEIIEAELEAAQQAAQAQVALAEDSDDSEDEESDSDEDESSSDGEEEKDDEDEDEYDDLLLFEAKRKVTEDQRQTEPIPEDIDLPFEEGQPLPEEPVLKKRREGLVQVNIISPRDDEDDYRKGIKKSKIRETKLKLARSKIKMRMRLNAKNKSKKAKACEADTSSGPSRRIKDKFRVEMANVIVTLLNPYRKADCKVGRITNTEDFKHLARKLTHFVMLKELKHVASIEDLQCNDNVKHKARDFIRKYMSKFGTIYERPESEQL